MLECVYDPFCELLILSHMYDAPSLCNKTGGLLAGSIRLMMREIRQGVICGVTRRQPKWVSTK